MTNNSLNAFFVNLLYMFQIGKIVFERDKKFEQEIEGKKNERQNPTASSNLRFNQVLPFDQNESKKIIAKCEIEDELHFNKMKLADLNVDCQLLILNRLNFGDLRSIAQTNKLFSDLAAQVFGHHLAKMSVFIDGSQLLANSLDLMEETKVKIENLEHFWRGFFTLSYEYIWISNQSIQIRNLNALVNLLEHFGEAIRTLTIRYDSRNSEYFKQISELVNERCTEALEHLELEYSFQNVLKHIKKPFESVKSLALNYFSNKDGVYCLPIDSLFPRMQQLNITLLANLNNSYIVRHFPNLNSLKLTASYFENDPATLEYSAEKLIKLNPQIKNIDFYLPLPHLLKVTSEYLRDLDTLTLAGFNIESEVHFGNVTKFVMEDFSSDPENLSFEKLQELQMSCFAHRCHKWIQFMEKQTNLQRLHIEKSDVDDELFKTITGYLPNLKEMSISFLKRTPIQPNTVIEFLDSHEMLSQFSLESSLDGDQDLWHRLQEEKLKNKWNITIRENQFIFERFY